MIDHADYRKSLRVCPNQSIGLGRLGKNDSLAFELSGRRSSNWSQDTYREKPVAFSDCPSSLRVDLADTMRRVNVCRRERIRHLTGAVLNSGNDAPHLLPCQRASGGDLLKWKQREPPCLGPKIGRTAVRFSRIGAASVVLSSWLGQLPRSTERAAQSRIPRPSEPAVLDDLVIAPAA